MDKQHCVKADLQSNNTVPKVIAFYLPQYHEIPENNKWWGKGFTEWTNVKRAQKIFEGQYQPQVPLNDNYYNLLDKKTVEWQTDLANKYGVYGFCYFHYYFCGKRLLEKPAENLLKWKDIPQKFCFAWANSTWARTWSLYKEMTDWTREERKDGNDSGILIEQTYGSEKDWEEHINYLIPFFRDPRYIKKDGKPIFLIYILDQIPCAREMLKVWDRIAKENDFPGIHIVSINQSFGNNPYVEAIAHYGIDVGLSRSFKANLMKAKRRLVNSLMKTLHCDYRIPRIWDYEFTWKAMADVRPYGNALNYLGAFVNYDDTPRQGREGQFLKDSSPVIFKKYMKKQFERARSVFHSEFIFLDAWNEWGEGNHLEPDQKNGYAYLEALLEAQKEYISISEKD